MTSKSDPRPRASRATLAFALLTAVASILPSSADAATPTWLQAAHRYKGVYDAGAIGNRGLQYQSVVAWNQGTSDPAKRGWIVTGQDENGVRVSYDYGATWTHPRLSGMFCSQMAGLYLNTDDDVFVAVGNQASTSSTAYAGLYVGNSSLLSAKRVPLQRGNPAVNAFTSVLSGTNSGRNINGIGRRPQTGGLSNANRPIIVIEQAKETGGPNITGIYVWTSADNGASWTMVRELTLATYAVGPDGIFDLKVAPNGDVLLMGQTGAFRSTGSAAAPFSSAPVKIYPTSGNKAVSSGYFFGGSATTASSARIGIWDANPGGVFETANIQTTAFTKPNNNAGLPSGYRVWHLGGSPMAPDRLAVCTDGATTPDTSRKPFYSDDGGRNFTELNDIVGVGDEQFRYNIHAIGASPRSHAGFYFCPTDAQKCLSPTAQTMARSVDEADTTNGDLVAGFDGMHTKGFGFDRTDWKNLARMTQDSGLNVSRDGMHWVRPAGWEKNSPFDVDGDGTIESGETFGVAIENAGGGSQTYTSGSGATFGTVNNRVVAFFNKNSGGQTNIPVVMDDPDGDGEYQNILIKAYTPNKPTRATHGRPSPKSTTVAFVGRWAISNLGASTLSGVTLADRYQGSDPREFIDCFLQSGTTVVSYWGNFAHGSNGNGSVIYRSTADLADTGLGTAWHTVSGTYPAKAICADHHTPERVLYVRNDDLHVIREVKRVSGSLVDSALVNLRTMTNGLEATVRAEVGDPSLPIPSMPIEQLICDPNKSGIFYAIIGRHGVPNWWMTVDNGVTWTNISDNAPRTIWEGAVHPLTGEVLGFSSMGEHVLKSPTVSGYPALTNRDAFTNQINAYMALRPIITTQSLAGAHVNSPYSQTLAATGGSGTKVWSLAAGTLPAGLSLSSGGVISGTPTTAQTRTFDVKVADSDGITGPIDEDIQTLTIVVAANSVPNITTASLPNGSVGTAYNQTLAATGGDGTLVWSLASGSLPVGLSLSGGGVISGTPTTAVTSNFTVRVADSDGNTGAGDEDTQALSITIDGGPVGIFAVNEDVGGPGLAGSASYNSGNSTYTVTGGGNDIWGTSDKFRYVHQPWTGDGRIIARVTAVEITHAWAKAGAMFRESNAANSKYALLGVSGSNGTFLEARATTGGSSTQVANVGAISAPYWVKLERHGNTFTGWQSPDGEVWFLTGATTFTMNSSARVGLAVTAHNDADLSTSTFTNVSLSNAPTWIATDIGSTGAAGSSSVNYTTDTYTVDGAGNNIFGTADAFQFYYQSWASGNATFIAEVVSVENTHAGAKAAIMIRQSLTNDSPHATIAVMPTNGIEMLTRTTSGGTTTQQLTSGVGAPRFIKLVRSGNSFTTFQSPDGGTWTQVGSAVTISMSGTVYIGLVSCSRVSGTLCTSTFSSVFLK